MKRLLAAILLSPGVAHANVGVGYLTLALPFVVLALIPAVIVEALIVQPILRIPFRRALSLSWWANLRSTLWGLGIAIGVDVALLTLTESAGPEPTRVAVFVMLVPFFVLSWWIEHRAVARLAPELPRKRIGVATGAANIVSYAGMFAMLWALYPVSGPFSSRIVASEALLAGGSARTAVTEYWQNHKRFPQDLKEADIALTPDSRFRVTLEPEGRVVVEIMVDDPALRGRRVTWLPVLGGEPPGILVWKCSAPEIEPRHLPSQCRPDAR